MDIQEVRKLSDKELVEKVYELKQDLMTLRFQQQAGNLENGSKIRDTRKSIAKCLTVQKERELEAKKAK
ncbi:MAG: 50S ribosomal protein L29 [Bacilli bacterium]|jgi:large subunit ribosomal protein L29|nr:50S ribosomal protein L29 [Bacilli bacterium]